MVHSASEQKTSPINAYVSLDLYKRYCIFAAKSGLKKREIIELALMEFLDREEPAVMTK